MLNIKNKLYLLTAINMNSSLSNKFNRDFSIEPLISSPSVKFKVYFNNFSIKNPEKFFIKNNPYKNIISSILQKIIDVKNNSVSYEIIKYLNYKDIKKILYDYLDGLLTNSENIFYNEIKKFQDNIGLILTKYYLNNSEDIFNFSLNVSFHENCSDLYQMIIDNNKYFFYKISTNEEETSQEETNQEEISEEEISEEETSEEEINEEEISEEEKKAKEKRKKKAQEKKKKAKEKKKKEKKEEKKRKRKILMNYYNECEKFLTNNSIINTITFFSKDKESFLDLENVFDNKNIEIFTEPHIKKYIFNNFLFSEDIVDRDFLNIVIFDRIKTRYTEILKKKIIKSNKKKILLEMNVSFKKSTKKVYENNVINNFIKNMEENNNHNISCKVFIDSNIKYNEDFHKDNDYDEDKELNSRIITIEFENHNYKDN
jgi:hypothetical protein